MGKQKTNEDFVRDLMMFSRRGALIQPFVLKALEFYSATVVESYQTGELGEAMQSNSFVSAEAWTDCAREVLEKMEGYYKTRGDL